VRPDNRKDTQSYQFLEWDHYLARRVSYSSGQQLAVYHEGVWYDAEVQAKLSPGVGGNLHALTLLSNGTDPKDEASLGQGKKKKRTLDVDLNADNHCVNLLSCDQYSAAVEEYLAETIDAHTQVIDGITGQTVNIRNQTVMVGITETQRKRADAWVEVNDVKELSAALVKAQGDRSVGNHYAQPLLLIAEAGAGKTWMTKQVLVEVSSMELDFQTRYIPLLLPVQRLAYLIRQPKNAPPTDHALLVEWFLRVEFGAGADQSKLKMLLDAFHSKRLLVILDGIDEAADLKDHMYALVEKTLVAGGHRFIATSRPEGVKAALYEREFVVIDLKKYTEEQQLKVIKMQLEGTSADKFFDNLFKFLGAQKLLDEEYQKVRGEGALEKIPAFDKTKSRAGNFFTEFRQTLPSGGPVQSVSQLLLAAGVAKAGFDDMLEAIAIEVGLPVSYNSTMYEQHGYGLIIVSVKDPERAGEKAKDKYQPQVAAGRRPPPAISWIADILRTSYVCQTEAQVLAVFEKLKAHPHCEVARFKNLFERLDPTHFRRFMLSVKYTVQGADGNPTGISHMCEVQIHLKSIYDAKNAIKNHDTYEYFRELFGPQMDQQLDPNAGWMSIDARLRLWGDFLGNPVLMSLFIVILKTFGKGNPDVGKLPISQAHLYRMAIKILVGQSVSKTLSGLELKETSKHVYQALQELAVKNHFALRREFDMLQLEKALLPESDASLWDETEVNDMTKVEVGGGIGRGILLGVNVPVKIDTATQELIGVLSPSDTLSLADAATVVPLAEVDAVVQEYRGKKNAGVFFFKELMEHDAEANPGAACVYYIDRDGDYAKKIFKRVEKNPKLPFDVKLPIPGTSRKPESREDLLLCIADRSWCEKEGFSYFPTKGLDKNLHLLRAGRNIRSLKLISLNSKFKGSLDSSSARLLTAEELHRIPPLHPMFQKPKMVINERGNLKNLIVVADSHLRILWLPGHRVKLDALKHQLLTKAGIPTVKVLDEVASQKSEGHTRFQSVHLSLQEFLCAEKLVEILQIGIANKAKGMPTINPPIDLDDDEAVTKFIENPFFKNMLHLSMQVGFGALLLTGSAAGEAKYANRKLMHTSLPQIVAMAVSLEVHTPKCVTILSLRGNLLQNNIQLLLGDLTETAGAIARTVRLQYQPRSHVPFHMHACGIDWEQLGFRVNTKETKTKAVISSVLNVPAALRSAWNAVAKAAAVADDAKAAVAVAAVAGEAGPNDAATARQVAAHQKVTVAAIKSAGKKLTAANRTLALETAKATKKGPEPLPEAYLKPLDMKVGDYINTINGINVTNNTHLISVIRLAAKQNDGILEMELWRGVPSQIEVEIAMRAMVRGAIHGDEGQANRLVRQLQTLQTLDLRDNHLCGPLFPAVEQFVAAMPELTTLDLRGNGKLLRDNFDPVVWPLASRTIAKTADKSEHKVTEAKKTVGASAKGFPNLVKNTDFKGRNHRDTIYTYELDKAWTVQVGKCAVLVADKGTVMMALRWDMYHFESPNQSPDSYYAMNQIHWPIAAGLPGTKNSELYQDLERKWETAVGKLAKPEEVRSW
jgi:hypothetical protein